MNQTNKLRDGAIYLAIFVVLMLITAFVPILSFLSLIVLPVPFILYAAKYNWKPALVMAAVSIVITLFVGLYLLTVFAAAGGIMIGSAIYNRRGAYETFGRGTFGFLVGALLVFAFMQLFFQFNWIAMFEEMLTQSAQTSLNAVEQTIPGDQFEQISTAFEAGISTFVNLLPAFLILSSAILAIVSQWVSYKILNRMSKEDFRFPKFRHLRIPSSVLWVFFFSLVLSFFDWETSTTWYMALQNLQMLTGLVMGIQGLSFVFFFSHYKKMSRAIPIITVILIFLFPIILIYILQILGIIDIGFKLKDRLEKNRDNR